MELTATAPAFNQSYTEDAFERLFKEHFKALHAYANMMLKDEEQAEEIVQQVFLKLWERREQLNIQISIKAYLYKSVHNDCLNYFQQNKTRAKYEDYASRSGSAEAGSAAKKLELKELEGRIADALDELPQQCRTIFQMSRFEELKYKEIAEQLGISIKTVENQMGKALKILRVKLAEFLPLVMLWLSNRFL
ncbi:RNA polymerase sigma-70 factor [Pedobacter sp. SYSU D00535]|uniref:RNA polymerase sigma-70 factor n=1 Tax=Pedobacter sp. SYSU D00535 TaxID=2810308 RepID=UPI001A9603A5